MTEETRSEEFKEEVKQTNFRLNQEDAEKFRRFCSENGLNHAQGFAHIIQAVEMNQAKDALPGQADNIENFEMHIKALLTGYMNLLEMNANSEARAKEEFAEQLRSKDKSIMDYQSKLEKEKEAVKALESQLGELDSLKKELALVKTELTTANQQIADKDNLLAMKNEKLDAAEEKVQAYDELLNAKQAVDTELADVKIQLKDKQTEMEQQLALVAVQYDKNLAQAIQAEKDTWSEKIDKLREKLQNEKDALQEQLRNDEKAAHQLEQQLRDEIRELEHQLGDLKLEKEKLQNDTDKKMEKMSRSYNTLQDEFRAYKKAHPEQQDEPDQLTLDDVKE